MVEGELALFLGQASLTFEKDSDWDSEWGKASVGHLEISCLSGLNIEVFDAKRGMQPIAHFFNKYVAIDLLILAGDLHKRGPSVLVAKVLAFCCRGLIDAVFVAQSDLKIDKVLRHGIYFAKFCDLLSISSRFGFLDLVLQLFVNF